MAELRFGRVSSVDYQTGRVSVYYSDKTKCVTGFLPMLSNGLFNLPEVGARVAVIHMSQDMSKGVVLGTLWDGNAPQNAAEGDWRLEIDGGDSFIAYAKESGTLTIKAPVVTVEQESGEE